MLGLYIVIIIPFFISLYLVLKRSVERAFLTVYVPVLLCFPLYDSLKLPSMPPITFADSAILPIGIWLVIRQWREWRFTRMDFWLVLFTVSVVWTMFRDEPTKTPALCYLFLAVTNAIFPYMIGKMIIEQTGMRLAVTRRFAFLLGAIGFLSLYEYRMGINPFHAFWSIFMWDGGLAYFEQIRWGFTRVSGPYAQSETTGMVFIVGTLFAYWLYRNGAWEKKFRFKRHPFTKRRLILIAVAIGMFINQARGPYIGIIFGFIIARTFRGRNLRGNIQKTAIILFVLLSLGYLYSKGYTSASWKTAGADQGDAIYRSLLIDNYMPIVKEGGLWGYGLHPPLVGGQSSIDNAYLFFALTQGYVGAITFAILILESLIASLSSLRYLRDKRDMEFAFCMAGCLGGLGLCLATVYLTSPVLQIVFLLLGWSQSLRKAAPAPEVAAPAEKYQGYRFRKVFT